MKKNRNNIAISFFETHGKWMGLLIISSVFGALLAIAKRNYEPLFFNLYQLINLEVGRESAISILKDSVIAYGLQLGMLWLCGLAPVGKHLGKAIFIGIGSTYSFTITSMLLLYGIKGVWVVIFTYGIQMASVLSMMIYIISKSDEGTKKNKGNSRAYYYLAGYIGLLVAFLGGVNIYIQPTLEKIIKQMIN